jgi:hypothetical protein
MRVILIISFFVLHLAGFSQERSLTISTDKESILIGEQMELKVLLKGASGDTMRLPLIEDTLITEIEVINRSKVDTSFEGAQLEQSILSQTYTITSFDSGYFPISPRIGLINGEEVESNPLLIAVQTIEIDTSNGIVDIMEIEDVPFSLKEWLQENWMWIAITLMVLGIITFIALKLSKQKPKEEPEIIIPERPAHELALERLEHLKEEKLWQAGKIKQYYSELSDILREYLESRFILPAMEQTTDEIIVGLRHKPDLNAEQIGQLKALLFLSDLVKFAKENPVGKENELNYNIVERFIEETIPAVKQENSEKDV